MHFKQATFFWLLAVFLFWAGTSAKAGTFREKQLAFPKVRLAYHKQENQLKKLFQKKRLEFPPKQIFIRAFKADRNLEVWVSNSDKFTLLKTFQICRLSGTYGPKRKRGDFQTPEGFYTIDRFNPTSSYHLSLGISYPNFSDKILGGKSNSGGDIFIHGGCGTRGCLPMTNDKIEELYLLAVEARDQGQKSIPIHIFPARLDKKGILWLSRQYKEQQGLLHFWGNLKEGYQYFEKNKTIFPLTVDAGGEYIITPPSG